MSESKSLSEMAAEAQPARGLRCATCGFDTVISVATVPQPGNKTLRYRECRRCLTKTVFVEKVFGVAKPQKARADKLAANGLPKREPRLPPKNIAAGNDS